jgi:hypothetical protein
VKGPEQPSAARSGATGLMQRDEPMLGPGVQREIAVGQPGDRVERKADAAADRVAEARRLDNTAISPVRVLAKEAAILHALGVKGIAAKYNQGLVIKRGTLQLGQVNMHGREPVNSRDSGWRIGPADDFAPPDEADLAALQVYQLLLVPPAMLAVMAFPYGYIAVFEGDEIKAVLDEHGRSRCRERI